MRQARRPFLAVAIFLACGFVQGNQKVCSSYEDPSTCNLAACSWKAQCTAINKNNVCKEAKTEDDCVADGCTWVSDSGKVSGCRDIVAEYCESLGQMCAEGAAFFCHELGVCEERSSVLLREVSQFAKQAISFFRKSEESFDRSDQEQTKQEWGIRSAQSNWEFNARSAGRFLSSNDTPPSPPNDTSPSPLPPPPSPTPSPTPSPLPPPPSPTPSPTPPPPVVQIQLVTSFSLSTCQAFEGSTKQATVRAFCTVIVSRANFPEDTYCIVESSTCSATSPGRVLLQTASFEAKIVQQGTFRGLPKEEVQVQANSAVEDIEGFKEQVINVVLESGDNALAEALSNTGFISAAAVSDDTTTPIEDYNECAENADCVEGTPYCLNTVPTACVQCLTGSDCTTGTCSELNECVAPPSPPPSPPPPSPSIGMSSTPTLPLVVLGISCVITMIS